VQKFDSYDDAPHFLSSHNKLSIQRLGVKLIRSQKLSFKTKIEVTLA